MYTKIISTPPRHAPLVTLMGARRGAGCGVRACHVMHVSTRAMRRARVRRARDRGRACEREREREREATAEAPDERDRPTDRPNERTTAIEVVEVVEVADGC